MEIADISKHLRDRIPFSHSKFHPREALKIMGKRLNGLQTVHIFQSHDRKLRAGKKSGRRTWSSYSAETLMTGSRLSPALRRECRGVRRGRLRGRVTSAARRRSDTADCPLRNRPHAGKGAARAMCLHVLGCHLGVTFVQAPRRTR